jgi:hypothetical protein
MPAPKGHKFTVGNKGGAPAHYETVEELIQACEAYFQQCHENGEDLTITGLALGLGFASRQSLYDYEKTEKFSYIIKRAKLLVEHGYELDLRSDHPTGAIFALKNMGWRDKHVLEHIDETDDYDDKSEEELDELIAKLQARKDEP